MKISHFGAVTTAATVSLSLAVAPATPAATVSAPSDGVCTVTLSEAEADAFATFRATKDFAAAQALVKAFPAVEKHVQAALKEQAVAQFHKANREGRTPKKKEARDAAIMKHANSAAEHGVPTKLFTNAVIGAAEGLYNADDSTTFKAASNYSYSRVHAYTASGLREDHPSLTETQISDLAEASDAVATGIDRATFDFQQALNATAVNCSLSDSVSVAYPLDKIDAPFKRADDKTTDTSDTDNTLGNQRGLVTALGVLFTIALAVAVALNLPGLDLLASLNLPRFF